MGQMVSDGFVNSRSGDLVFILHPGYLTSDDDVSKTGTSHGSSFNYDTHVPLIWYGKNVPKKEVFRRVDIVDITATLTHILNLQKPNATTGEPILEMFKE